MIKDRIVLQILLLLLLLYSNSHRRLAFFVNKNRNTDHFFLYNRYIITDIDYTCTRLAREGKKKKKKKWLNRQSESRKS